MKMNKRFHWLIVQIGENKYTLGAEIGCFNGGTSRRLLKFCPELTLICVDLWEHVPEVHTEYQQGVMLEKDLKYDEIKDAFDLAVEPYLDRVQELRGISWEMADQIEDNSLDFVFIDADHGYEAVKKDIQAWVPKLKEGGLLSGHDINIPGVLQAVSESTVDWIDTGVNNVWCCKKEDYVGF